MDPRQPGQEGQNKKPEETIILNTSLIQMAFDKKKESDEQERHEIQELQ